jgi:prepilin-type N-terminal cleavage/methylation domain-containing protein
MPNIPPHSTNTLKKNNLANANGFTLAELLIAVSILSVIVGGIIHIITGQVRQNISQELRTQLAEEWASVASFINDDLFSSERAYVIDSSTSAADISNRAATGSGICSFSTGTIKMGLLLNDATTYIVYAVSPITPIESRVWRGPFVLRRCGPFDATGALAGPVSESILIGNLPSKDSFTANRGLNSLGGALAARDIKISLAIEDGAFSYSGILGGQSRVSPTYNLLRDDLMSGDSCSLSQDLTALACGSGRLEIICNPGTYCAQSAVFQYKPTGTAEIFGSTRSDIEDAVYFPNNISSYSFGSCNRNLCTVTTPTSTVTIHDGNVLVFADIEKRI